MINQHNGYIEVEKLLTEAASYRSHGVQTRFEVTFVEVYNEQVNDLISGERNLKTRLS